MAGIQKSVELFSDLGDAGVSGIELYRKLPSQGGPIAYLPLIPVVWDILSKAKELADDVQGLLPELTDLDGEEAGQLASAGYAMIQKVAKAWQS